MKAYQEFLRNYPVSKYTRGQSILEQGVQPGCAYVVKEGYVKTFDIGHQGEIVPLLFDHKYEIFPMAWVFSYADTAPYFYEAFTDCELWCVPKEDFVAFLKSNANSQFLIFDFFVRRYLLSLQIKTLGLAQGKAADKLLYLLKFFTVRFGGDKTSGLVEIDLPVTQQDIASSVGLTRETASIELKKLERRGIIVHKNHKYIVDLAKLNEAIDL